MTSTDIPKQYCWKCGYKMDRTTEAYGDHKPSPGDISICASCGVITVFTDDLTLRKPTIEELEKLEADPRLIHLQITRAYVIGDKLKEK